MKFIPRPYQQLTYDFALENPFCGLFLDMGLGKTAVTLALINRLMFKDLTVTRCLVIAPKRVAETVWSEEALKWDDFHHMTFSKVLGLRAQRVKALNTGAHIDIINRENVPWLCEHYDHELPYDMIIIDESSSFRNHAAKRFKSLKRSISGVQRIILLTGTPAPNGLLGLWAQLYLLDRGARLHPTISGYRSKYFRPGRILPNGIVANYIPLPGAAESITDSISDICISLNTQDCVGLPELVTNSIEFRLSPAMQKMYDDFERDEYIENAQGEAVISTKSAAAMRNKLLQFTSGAVYTEAPEYVELHNEKMQVLTELIEGECADRNVLIAYSYRHERDRLLRDLSGYGARALETAKDIEEWNAGNVRVLIAHPASAGHGLNLQTGGADTIWFGLTDDLEQYQQFNKRLHRSGQTSTRVVIHHIVAVGTQDKFVVQGLKNKDTRQQSLLNAVDALRAKYDERKHLNP